jgi:hypothetical protein
LQQQRKRAAATKAKGPRQKFISFQMFLFLAFASRRRPRGLQIRIKTNAKEAKVACAFLFLFAFASGRHLLPPLLSCELQVFILICLCLGAPFASPASPFAFALQ